MHDDEPRTEYQATTAPAQQPQRRWSVMLSSRFVLMCGGGVLVLACVVAGFMVSLATGQPSAQVKLRAQEHAAAQQRWSARPFRAYRMVLEYGQCYMDIEIRNEHFIWAHEASCERRSAQTVSGLLQMAGTDQSRTPYCSIAHGCTCELITAVEAQYDPLFGYPTMIRTQVQAWPDRWHPDYWRYVVEHWQEPDCTLANSRTIRILALTPLRP